MRRNKVEYCMNPITHRKIKIGGRSWKNLVSEGKLNSDGYQNPNIIYTVDESEYDDPEEVKQELYRQKTRIIKENAQNNLQGKFSHTHPVVKGNKIYKAKNKITNEESSRLTADSAIDVIDDIQNNRVDIPSNMNREEAHQYLQGLIFNKMLQQKKQFKNTKLTPKKVPVEISRRQNIHRKVLKKKKVKKKIAIAHEPPKPIKRRKKIPQPVYVEESESEEEEIPTNRNGRVQYIDEPEPESESETEYEEVEYVYE